MFKCTALLGLPGALTALPTYYLVTLHHTHLTFLRSLEFSIRVRKNENSPDSKIFVTKTFRKKRVNCINFQIRDKYA